MLLSLDIFLKALNAFHVLLLSQACRFLGQQIYLDSTGQQVLQSLLYVFLKRSNLSAKTLWGQDELLVDLSVCGLNVDGRVNLGDSFLKAGQQSKAVGLSYLCGELVQEIL